MKNPSKRKPKGKKHVTRKTKRKSTASAKPRVIPAASEAQAVHQQLVDQVISTPPAQQQGVIVGISKGVFQTQNNSSAIVIAISRTKVQFVTFMDGEVEVKTMSHDVFRHTFAFALPHYPVRRAARIYLNSFLTKTEEAERVLRALLAS